MLTNERSHINQHFFTFGRGDNMTWFVGYGTPCLMLRSQNVARLFARLLRSRGTVLCCCAHLLARLVGVCMAFLNCAHFCTSRIGYGRASLVRFAHLLASSIGYGRMRGTRRAEIRPRLIRGRRAVSRRFAQLRALLIGDRAVFQATGRHIGTMGVVESDNAIIGAQRIKVELLTFNQLSGGACLYHGEHKRISTVFRPSVLHPETMMRFASQMIAMPAPSLVDVNRTADVELSRGDAGDLIDAASWYTDHVNLPKRLAVPRAFAALRGFVMPNYTISSSLVQEGEERGAANERARAKREESAPDG
jgi:hypothetical protein